MYAPNSYDGPAADPSLVDEGTGYSSVGDATRADYIKHAEDDDYVQGHNLIRSVMDDPQRERLVENVVGHLLNGVREPVLSRAFEMLGHLDAEIGKKIETAYHEQAGSVDETTGQGPAPKGALAAKI